MPYCIELSDKVVKTLVTIASYTNEQLHHLSNTQALQQLLLFRDLSIQLTTSSSPQTEMKLSTLIYTSEQQSQISDHLCLYCGNQGHIAYNCYNKPAIYIYSMTGCSPFSQTFNISECPTSTSNFPDN